MKKTRITFIVLGLSALITAFHTTKDTIPKTWDSTAIKHFHLPPPDTTVKVVYAPESYYNGMPEHVITKSFPVYLREFEKPGYIDSLRHLKPEIAFDPSKFKTQQDWIDAGEVVFNWPVAYSPITQSVSPHQLSQFENSRSKTSPEGIYLANRYVLDEPGTLVMGALSCASCHTQVLESGKIVPGGPGNVFNSNRFLGAVRSGKLPLPFLQEGSKRLNYAPWAKGQPFKPVSSEEFGDYVQSITEGVIDRQGVAYLYPLAIPNLIGIKDIKYLDHTGLMKHDGPGDMMRYAAFNQGMDMLTSYDGFIPGGDDLNSKLPEVGKPWNHPFGYATKRYNDEQLYALTQYIYSLQPPENPNKFPGELVELGNKVFIKSGCVTCHTPPLYTNNKLTPVNGFEPPKEHFEKYDIFNVSVETDSVSALYSRRGTGYYKIPSLRGMWYQRAFFHNGNLASLEEVFNPKRLAHDYIPDGFTPPHVKTMAVKGHPFGLELSNEEKKALIAFLKTL